MNDWANPSPVDHEVGGHVEYDRAGDPYVVLEPIDLPWLGNNPAAGDNAYVDHWPAYEAERTQLSASLTAAETVELRLQFVTTIARLYGVPLWIVMGKSALAHPAPMGGDLTHRLGREYHRRRQARARRRR